MTTIELGQLVITRIIDERIRENKQFSLDVSNALDRYLDCDWGELCEEDKELNNSALNNNNRIIAEYNTCEGAIWIITEWDRSYTTVLFPDEY